MPPFTCGYCTETSTEFKQIINHLVTAHCDKEIKIRKLDGSKQRTLNFNVIPELCREQGREITINENIGTVHVSKPNKIPKDSPFKKLIKTVQKDSNNGVSEITPGPIHCTPAEDNENDQTFVTLSEMLPTVIQSLKGAGKMNEYIQFNRLLSDGKFPMTNIAFLLFLDIVRWYSLDDSTTTMRYCEEVKEFWRTGLRLFHGRFLRFMGGPKNKGQIRHNEISAGSQRPEAAKVNFVVPDRRVLVDETKIVESSNPSILYDVIETVSQSDPDQCQTFKICVDGKKINPCSSGEINLWGYEDSPTFKERLSRFNNEINYFQDLQARLEKLINFGHTSISTISEGDTELIKDACKTSVTVLSTRIKDLRQLKVKNETFLQKLLGKVEGDWRSSTYCMVISSLRTRIYMVENCIDDLLKCNDSLCKYASAINKMAYLTTDGPSVALQRQENLVCLANSNSSEEPHLTKQRTEAWKQFREGSLVTGSTINKAIGLDGLKKQKEYFAERFGGKTTPAISEDLQKRFDYGTENEINAVATFVSTFMPAFVPDGCFYEEGCYPERKNGDIVLTVSPDGSVRNDENETICGIEIKCPMPGKVFTEPVQYVIPRYYICQILSEMYCLKVDHLYFLSYSKDSMTVLHANYDADLWAMIFREIECLDKGNVPKKLGVDLGKLKEKISDYQIRNVSLVAELRSKKAIPCEHSPHETHDIRIRHERSANDVLNASDSISMSQVLRTFLRCGEVVRQCNKLCVKKASEVLVFLLGDLDRVYKSELPHAFPIAYGFKGYSMSTETMRKMINDVLYALFIRGIYAPVVSYDGQWGKLAFQAPDGTPLTILELQRQLYNDVKARSVTAVIKNIFETNVVKADTFVDLLENVDLMYSERGSVSIGPKDGKSPYRISASLASMIREIKPKRGTKEAKEKMSETEMANDSDLDYIISCIPTEVFAEADNEVVVIVREIGSEADNTEVSSNLMNEEISSSIALLYQGNDESSDIDAAQGLTHDQSTEPVSNSVTDINSVIETETPEVMETVTVVTETDTSFDYNDVVAMIAALQSKSKASQKWNKCNANELHDIILGKHVYEKMTTNDILVCLESSRTTEDCKKVHFCKSWKKEKLANVLQDGFLGICVTEKSPAIRRKRKNPDKLANLCKKGD